MLPRTNAMDRSAIGMVLHPGQQLWLYLIGPIYWTNYLRPEAWTNLPADFSGQASVGLAGYP
jgi:hypothetical protein